MPDRFLDAYDQAHSLSMEAIWEKYASRRDFQADFRKLNALDAACADVELPPLIPELEAA